MTKLTKLFKGDKYAIIHPFNAEYRVLDGDYLELFFSDYSNALKHLLNEGYKINFIDNNR